MFLFLVLGTVTAYQILGGTVINATNINHEVFYQNILSKEVKPIVNQGAITKIRSKYSHDLVKL